MKKPPRSPPEADHAAALLISAAELVSSKAAAANATRISARSTSLRLSMLRLLSGAGWQRSAAGFEAVLVALQHFRADGFLDAGDGIFQRQPILHFGARRRRSAE